MDDSLIPQEHRAAIERLREIKAKPAPHSMMHVMVRLIDLQHYLAALDYLEDVYHDDTAYAPLAEDPPPAIDLELGR